MNRRDCDDLCAPGLCQPGTLVRVPDGRVGTVVCGDVLDVLPALPAESVNCVVTSPPYWGLRDYGVPGQLGLEPTPDEYVAKMVAVFREVRRVLRDDGTLWLNLGDSYASGGGGRHGDNSGVYRAKGNVAQGRAPRPDSLKPKDLCMIPARVAMALQQPYYTGAVARERDRVWLAAMVDGEGCIYISRSKKGATTGRDRKYVRTQDAFDVGVKITNTNRALIEEVRRLVGCGSVRVARTRDRDAWEWAAYSGNARRFIREVYPYLVAKQHEARILLGCPPSGDLAAAAHQALKGLHNGIPTDLDFPAPAPMFEQGWYLRSDIIWSKTNSMPESVTDRPTKAHEYVFLMSKAARYCYDAEAVAELTDGRERFGNSRILTHDDRRDCSRQDMTQNWSRNRRTVWHIATQPYPEAHFATYPEKLVEPCILAGCPEGGTVLDPFTGSGTTGAVACRLGRNFVGIELNHEYAAMAERRIAPHRDQLQLAVTP